MFHTITNCTKNNGIFSWGGDWKREFLHNMFIESKTPLSSKSYFSHTHTPLPPPRSYASDVTLAPPPTQTQFFAFISFLPSFRAYFTSLLDTQNCRALALRQEEGKKWSAGNKSERALDPITLHQTHLKHSRYVCALY